MPHLQEMKVLQANITPGKQVRAPCCYGLVEGEVTRVDDDQVRVKISKLYNHDGLPFKEPYPRDVMNVYLGYVELV